MTDAYQVPYYAIGRILTGVNLVMAKMNNFDFVVLDVANFNIKTPVNI